MTLATTQLAVVIPVLGGFLLGVGVTLDADELRGTWTGSNMTNSAPRR